MKARCKEIWATARGDHGGDLKWRFWRFPFDYVWVHYVCPAWEKFLWGEELP